MLHAYCVRHAGDPPPEPGLEGVGGATVELVRADALGVWTSAGDPGPASPERLRAHDRVLRAALRTATPVPVRYGGGLFRGREELLEQITRRREHFVEALSRVRGRVEVGLRVEWREMPSPAAAAPPASPGAGPGRSYLERRREELQRSAWLRREAEAELERVATRFAALDAPCARSVRAAADGPGSLAHLVQVAQLAAFRDRVRGARRELPSLLLTPSGPWAPYSFV